jgi:hypothetical protein
MMLELVRLGGMIGRRVVTIIWHQLNRGRIPGLLFWEKTLDASSSRLMLTSSNSEPRILVLT